MPGWTYSEFTVTYNPEDHTLCGPLAFTVKYDGVVLVNGDTPLDIDLPNRTFTIFTDDPTL